VKEALGWAGMLMLGLCALPLLLATLRDGHANGIDPFFLALWLGGEVTMLCHVLLSGTTKPILANYIANTFMVSVIGMYRWFS
jgi:hypothetical protein